MKPEADMIKHPPHYTRGQIQVWDFIIDQQLNYLAGNVVKYLCRYRFKGDPLESLRKAEAYLKKLIAVVEEGGPG